MEKIKENINDENIINEKIINGNIINKNIININIINENNENVNIINENINNENNENENKINENDLIEFGNNTSKCIQNLSLLLDNIKENIKNNKKMKENEFLLNLLLMTWNLNLANKVFCLYLLSDIYNFTKNIPMLFHVANKVIKYSSNEVNEVSKKQITDILYKISSLLFIDKNYYNSYKYIIIANNFLKETKNNYFPDLNQKVIESMKIEIDNKLNYFKSEENQQEILEIYNLINNIVNNRNTKEDCLYAINKNWINKAKLFLECFLEAKQKNEINKLYKESFNLENILNNYFIEDINNINEYYLYPGPINNIPLVSSKDEWNEKEENYFISNNNYVLIENEKWVKLKNFFNSTNEIKKNKSKLMEIKVILFNQQMKSQYDTINMLKQKSLIIEQNLKIADLKEKINKIINFNFHNTDKMQFKFFIINKKYKHILLEMCIAYINKITSYDSLFINELILDDENEINDLIEKYNQKNYLFIIETFTNENEQFIKQIKPKKSNDSITCKCSSCNKETQLNNKFECDKCNMSFYCCFDCSINDNHIKLHENLNKMLYNFDLNEFLDGDLKSIFKDYKNINKGKVGLYNLGNTCYMNSALQCLSNTKDLRKYFIKKLDESILNFDNRINTAEGLIVNEFSKLIKHMWLTENNILNPLNFRNFFIQLYTAFYNQSQQDSQEFLSALLNILDIGLNRNFNNQNNNFGKEESIISDLFQGELKNIIKCKKCNQIKINKEKYMFLSLPIPEKHSSYKFKFFKQDTCIIFDMIVDKNTTINDVIIKCSDYLSKEILDALTDIYIKHNCENSDYISKIKLNSIDIAILDENRKVINIYDNNYKPKDILNKKIQSFIEDKEVCFFERHVLNDFCYNIYVYPIYSDIQSNNNYYFSYPVAFSVKQDITLENLENLIINRFKILFKENNINKNMINLIILHSARSSINGMFSFLGDKKKCPFCGNDYDEIKFCPLYYTVSKSDSILKIIQKTKSKEPIILGVRSSFYNMDNPLYNEISLDKFSKDIDLNKNLNIYDSLNLFEKEEILEKENMCFCEKCKKNQIVSKNITISKLPLYLVFQFKRFKRKENGFFSFLSSDKVDKFVYYPTKNLNLKKYCDDSNNYTSYEYNLYAVIKHSAFNDFGHYTAICYNDNAWIEYDDEVFSNSKSPVNKNAYLLFYIKKEIDK